MIWHKRMWRATHNPISVPLYILCPLINSITYFLKNIVHLSQDDHLITYSIQLYPGPTPHTFLQIMPLPRPVHE